MKLLTTMSFVCLISFSFSAMASNSFWCKGSKSEFTLVKGIYLGEISDSVQLDTNQTYSIYSSGGGRTLEVKLEDEGIRTGVLRNFPLQFVARQRDDLGRTTTRFAIPLGVFGGSVGKKFEAVLAVNVSGNEVHRLNCELVSPYSK